MQTKSTLLIILVLYSPRIVSYTLPQVGLGTSSFLDGGPLRQVPGWYWQNYLQGYHSNTFVDDTGKELVGINNPNLNVIEDAIQFIYLSRQKFLGGSLGVDFTLPTTLYSHVRKNDVMIASSGSGIGDLVWGTYIQWDPIMHGERPIFVHRLEFVAVFPTGKNKLLNKTINPGSRIFYLDPYWSVTLYFTPRFTASWRLHYLWCGTNHITHIQAGQAIHFNYAVDYAFNEHFICGINGYYLRQITPSRFKGVTIPDSKERVFAIGPGALWVLGPNYTFDIFANLYFEMDARNRTQGVRAIFRVLKHF